MLKNLTIKVRLIYVLSFLTIQLIFGAVMGLTALTKSNSSMSSVYNNQLVALGDLDMAIRQINRGQMLGASVLSASPEKSESYLNELDASRESLTKYWSAYTSTVLSQDERELVKRFEEARKNYEDNALQPLINHLKNGDKEGAAQILHQKMTPAYNAVREIVDKLIKLQLTEAASEQKVAEDRYTLVRNICGAGLIIGVLTAVGMGIWLIRSIVKPLNQAADIANKVAMGDLTVKIETTRNDETGRLLTALNTMMTSLAIIVKDVRSSTETITVAASEIAAGNQDLSSRTEQQAANLEETASSMEELTSTVKQNADNADQGNRLALAARDTAKRGSEVMSSVVATMAEINTSAHRISEIISVIDGIAFQTNILALNAAVEAARAGEQGRGFAVVATEVRSLAGRSAQAAREIKSLITTSSEQVEEGTRQVQLAGTTMADIQHSVGQVTNIIAEISAASYEQSSGIEQVNNAVTHMDQVTQQNAALVEQAAAASASLDEEARRLSQAVSVFHVN